MYIYIHLAVCPDKRLVSTPRLRVHALDPQHESFSNIGPVEIVVTLRDDKKIGVSRRKCRRTILADIPVHGDFP